MRQSYIFILEVFSKFLRYLFICLALLAAISIFIANLNSSNQHFALQADSFLHNRTDILNPYSDHDFTIFNGKYYWPEGPFPSVILVPFVAVFSINNFNQGSMQLILIAITIIFLYKLIRLKKYNFEDSFFLINAFLLGSPAVWLVIDSKSWFYAQVVAITFLVTIVYELETKRRFWLMGLLSGALLATRPTSAFIAFLIIPLILLEKDPIKNKLTKLISFSIFPTISALALGFYNYSRFGNFFDNGYSTNNLGGFLEPLRQMGVFSLSHIPTNIYYYFLASVLPVTKISAHLEFPFIKFDVWGLSFFLVAPFFIYSFKTLKNFTASSLLNKLYWITIAVTLLVLLSYFAPGWYQFGPRYTADFLPLLFVLTLNSLNGKLTSGQKLLISASAFLNLYLIYTYLSVPV